MSKTTNCHIKDAKDGDVYCGRGRGDRSNVFACEVGTEGWLGNPASIGKRCSICCSIHKNGGDTLPCYESYLINRLQFDEEFKTEFHKLRGKRLVCFCKPNPCHTDIMIKYLDKETNGNN